LKTQKPSGQSGNSEQSSRPASKACFKLATVLSASEGSATHQKMLYLIGSLRNDRIPVLAEQIRKDNPRVEVFDDWYAAGFEADDMWKSYELGRGRTYQQALNGYAAQHVFDFDCHHLNRSTHALLVLPAGKSGHMEITYAKYGAGAKAAILLDPNDDPRFDIMYKFVDDILANDNEIADWLNA
jgi:hypothetical protein